MVLILKSMPIVVINDGVKLSSEKRSRQHDFPTPESPIRSSFIYMRGQHWTVEGGGGGLSGEAYQEVIISGAGHGGCVMCSNGLLEVCLGSGPEEVRGAGCGRGNWVIPQVAGSV